MPSRRAVLLFRRLLTDRVIRPAFASGGVIEAGVPEGREHKIFVVTRRRYEPLILVRPYGIRITSILGNNNTRPWSEAKPRWCSVQELTGHCFLFLSARQSAAPFDSLIVRGRGFVPPICRR